MAGTPGDYNHWKALGNEGWGYEDLEPYFVKSETAYSHPRSQFRGHGGMYPSKTPVQHIVYLLSAGVWQNQDSSDPYRTNE